MSLENTKVLLVGNFLSEKASSRSVIEDVAEYLEGQGIKCLKTSNIENRYLRVMDMLLKAVLKKNQYHIAIVDLYSGAAFRWAELLSRVFESMNRPFVFIMHGGGLPDFYDANPERVTRCIKRASLLITPSNFLYRKFSSVHPKIKIISNGIRIQDYSYREAKMLSPKLLWLRAFHQVYNPQLAVRVLSQVLHTYPDAKLTMVGPDKGDESFQDTKKLAEELDILDHIRFVSGLPKDKVPNVMCQNEIFINTSTVDNSPVTLVEAMASGLNVISTNVGGIKDWVEDKQEALLVPSNDEAAMANAIKLLLEDPGYAKAIRDQARVKAEKHDFKIVFSEWPNILANITPKN